MNIEIYYFSGTGNSFVIADKIARKLNALLIPVAKVINGEKISTNAEVIGIVFPVYNIDMSGLPLIIEKFAEKLVNTGSKYIFAVSTFGGGSLWTFDNLNKILEKGGGKLSTVFGIQMPQNAFKKPFENRKKIFAKIDKKIDSIYKIVKSKKTTGLDNLRNILLKLLLGPILPLAKKEHFNKMKKLSNGVGVSFNEAMYNSDRSYSVDENCNGCGICEKVCPVGNIKIINLKPVWQNHCETCLSCYNWCPKDAIIGGIIENKKGVKYHYLHPEIKLNDIKNDKNEN